MNFICILQSRSPTCGVYQIYDGSFSGTLICGHKEGPRLSLSTSGGSFRNFLSEAEKIQIHFAISPARRPDTMETETTPAIIIFGIISF